MTKTAKPRCVKCGDVGYIRDPNSFCDPVEGYKMATYLTCPACSSTRMAPTVTSKDEISTVLAERGNRYGEFHTHAELSEAFRDVAMKTPGWSKLPAFMKESLILQWHKQARILNGDPWYDDSWVDIGGYAKLVVERIRAVLKKEPKP